MTKLGVNPPVEGVSEEKKEKDVEKDPKIFTVVQPCPQMVPVQMPPYHETRNNKGAGVCGVLLRIALISVLFALFAVALVIAFSGHDGIRSLFGEERTLILVPEKITLNSETKPTLKAIENEQQQKETAPVFPLSAQKHQQNGPTDSDESDEENGEPEMQIAILAMPAEGLMGESEDKPEGPEEKTPVGDEGIDGNEESVPDEEKSEQVSEAEMPVQMIEGGNVPDLASIWDMRQQQAMRIWRLRRIQQALFQQELMKEMIARHIMQAMSQKVDEQQQQSEMEQRLAHWQQMQMARFQQQYQMRAEQEQAWKQQQMMWAMQRPQVEYWPQPQNVLNQPHWGAEGEEQQQRMAQYWNWARQQQAEMQRRQMMQMQWAQQQRAAQSEAEARAHEQEERMKAWQQAQQQYTQQQAIAVQQQQQQQMQMQMQMQQQMQQQQVQQNQQQMQQPLTTPPTAQTTPTSALIFKPMNWVHIQPQNIDQVPVRPHDASAQEIVNQLQNTQPQPAFHQMPSMDDRVYQHFQQIAQNFNSGFGFRPTFSAVPTEQEQAQEQARTDEIYNEMLNKALAMRDQNETETTTVVPVEKSTEPVVIEDSFPKLTVEGGDDKTEGDSSESESVPDEEKAGDPLAEFFRFFENEAMKMGEQPVMNAEEGKKEDSSMPTPAPLAVGNAEVDAAEPHIVETTKTKTDEATQTELQPNPSAEVEPPKSAADLGAPVPIPITSAASTA